MLHSPKHLSKRSISTINIANVLGCLKCYHIIQPKMVTIVPKSISSMTFNLDS